MSKYKVWECKIVVSADTELPAGFDSPPRQAAKNAVEADGIRVLAVFSGWGGELTLLEKEILEEPFEESSEAEVSGSHS